MVSRSVLAFLTGLAVIPAAGQQFRLQSNQPARNPLANAIHSFVTRNANLPPAAQPKKTPEKKVPRIRMKPLKLMAANPCSIPLTNVRPPVDPNRLNMPVITQGGHLVFCI